MSVQSNLQDDAQAVVILRHAPTRYGNNELALDANDYLWEAVRQIVYRYGPNASYRVGDFGGVQQTWLTAERLQEALGLEGPPFDADRGVEYHLLQTPPTSTILVCVTDQSAIQNLLLLSGERVVEISYVTPYFLEVRRSAQGDIQVIRTSEHPPAQPEDDSRLQRELGAPRSMWTFYGPNHQDDKPVILHVITRSVSEAGQQRTIAVLERVEVEGEQDTLHDISRRVWPEAEAEDVMPSWLPAELRLLLTDGDRIVPSRFLHLAYTELLLVRLSPSSGPHLD